MKQILLLFIVLGAMLAAAIWGAWDIWFHSAEADIGFHGTLALILGAGASLVIGGGLMALVFISSRRGYDDDASS
ncbi:MAG: hypothetical protein P8N43_02835 [Alphaproteobacteria bacterium]|jgi:hypothetical protein|nr:hypothetical protein [Alphaproteobacteria bacterium]